MPIKNNNNNKNYLSQLINDKCDSNNCSYVHDKKISLDIGKGCKIQCAILF